MKAEKIIKLILIFLYTGCFFTNAQNISNPNFEIFSSCPTAQSQLVRATGWTQPTTAGTPDYMNTCPGGLTLSPQSLSAQSGNGFVGGYAEVNSGAINNYKEYLTNQLSTPLVAGVTYRFSFYVAHLFGASPSSFSPVVTYVDLPAGEQGFIGAVFSTASPSNSNTVGGGSSAPLLNTFGSGRALISSTNTDVYGATSRNNWVKVTLQYTAVGGEQYMTIGQLRQGAATTLSSGQGAYYLYDNFSADTDLSITKTDGIGNYTPGTSTTYTIVARNNGPIAITGAIVTDNLPIGIPAANMSYTAVASSGSTTSVSGTQTGAINDVVSLLVNGTVTYTVTVNIPSSFTGDLINTATINSPSGNSDFDLSNNSATDIDQSCVSGDSVLWFKADKGVNSITGVPTDNTQLTTWFDLATANGSQNGGTASVHPGSPAETDLPELPFYRYNSVDNFNFNPVLNFNATNYGQAVQFTTPAKGCQTVFTVFKSAGVNESTFYFSGLLYGGDALRVNPNDGDGIPKSDITLGVRTPGRLVIGGGSNGDFNIVGDIQLNSLPSIGTFKRSRVGLEEVYLSMYGSGSTDIANVNADPTNTRTGEGRDLINSLRIGKAFSAYENGLASPRGKLNGSYAELMVFNYVLTDTERAKVESYLAIKYGITLTGGTKQAGSTVGNVGYNYVNSDGTVIRLSEATYKYDVFGLGRDDFYGLNQRISKSNNPGDILTVSTSTDLTSLNLDTARTGIDGDKEFMLFANNRGSANAVVQQTTELPANIERRIDREWKVAKANTDGTDIPVVSLKFNLTGITLSSATASNILLLIDTDGDGNFTTGTIQSINASSYIAGSEVSFNNISLTNGQVFTLGIAGSTPFPCDGTAYLLKGPNNNGQLFKHNVVTGITDPTPLASFGGIANGLGYSPIDNTLWMLVTIGNLGTSRAKLTRVDAAGVVTTFEIPNLPTALGINPSAAGITSTGYFVAKTSSATTGAPGAGTAGVNDGDNYVVIDINPSRTATYLQIVDPANSYAVSAAPYFKETVGNTGITMADLAYNSNNGLFYGVTNTGSIATLNISTGAFTIGNPMTLSTGASIPVSATYNSTYIDATGFLYAIDGNGITYRIQMPTGNAVIISNAGIITNGDGANCPSAVLAYTIQGNVFKDINGLDDGIVNGTPTNVGNTLNAILYNNTTGAVAAIKPVATNGIFAFGAVLANLYSVYITTNTATVGQTLAPIMALPSGYKYTGEYNCGIIAGCTGNDGTSNGILSLGAVNSDISQANFGIRDLCYKPAATTGGLTLDTKIGITTLSRAGSDNTDNWPMIRKGGWIALESKTKGMVINRVAFSDADSNPSTPDLPIGISSTDFVEGMMVYDTTNHCLKTYTSTDGGSSYAWYCLSTQTCPD
jgi:hypothetical protein